MKIRDEQGSNKLSKIGEEKISCPVFLCFRHLFLTIFDPCPSRIFATFFFQNTGALTLFLTLNHRKFLSTKWRTKNKPKILDQRPPDRNFCRVDDFGYSLSARQKIQSGLSDRGFLAYFWFAILYPKFFCDRVSGKGIY